MKTLKDYEYFRTENGVLYCGDNMEILPLITDEIDFLFADPPYGVNKAEWDNKFVFKYQNIIETKKGMAITPGQNKIAECIIESKEKYKGLVCARNLNGMTFCSLGFENIIPIIMFGKIKRGQNYFDFIVNGEKPEHPSPKPIQFIEKLFLIYTEKNDLILDPFLGSGTTALACEKLNRRWIGIEISEKYCEIAKKRVEEYTSQLKLFK